MTTRPRPDELSPLAAHEVVRALARRLHATEREVVWALPWARLAQCPVGMIVEAGQLGVPPRFLVDLSRVCPIQSMGFWLLEALWRRRALVAAAALSGWGAAERHLVGPQGLKGVSAAALAPAYPRVSLTVAARLALGESPAAICEGVLTAREAHEWFLAGGPPEGASICEEAICYLARDLNLPGQVEELKPAVVRWLLRHQDEVHAWARDGRLSRAAIELLALAEEKDLRGQKSLQGLLRRLTIKAASDEPRQVWRLPLPPEARHLASDRALKVEGLEMAHCLGTYTLGVWWERTYPFALENHEGRSTLTLSRSASGEWFVDQHRGRANSTPPTGHVQVVAAWLKQLNSLQAPAPAEAAEGGWGPTPAAA